MIATMMVRIVQVARVTVNRVRGASVTVNYHDHDNDYHDYYHDYHDHDNDCAGGKCHGEQRGAARRVESPTNSCALIQTNALRFQI